MEFPAYYRTDAVLLRLTADNDLTSWVIRGFIHSRYSHVDAVVSQNVFIGATVEKGVALHCFRHDKEDYYWLTGIDPDRFWEFIHRNMGKPYDWTAIAGFVFHRDWQEDDSWFCFELIAAAIEYSSSYRFPRGLRRVTPKVLFDCGLLAQAS